MWINANKLFSSSNEQIDGARLKVLRVIVTGESIFSEANSWKCSKERGDGISVKFVNFPGKAELDKYLVLGTKGTK